MQRVKASVKKPKTLFLGPNSLKLFLYTCQINDQFVFLAENNENRSFELKIILKSTENLEDSEKEWAWRVEPNSMKEKKLRIMDQFKECKVNYAMTFS